MRLGHLCHGQFGTDGHGEMNVPTPHHLTRRMAGRISRFELARQIPPSPLDTVPLCPASGTRWWWWGRWIVDRSANRIFITLVPLDSLLDPEPALSRSQNLGVPFL